MTFVLNNRVWEITTTTGTSDLSLEGAADSNFDTFLGGVGVGNTTHYCIVWGSGFEFGVGTVLSGPSLQRTTVIGNSLHTVAKVDLPAGEKAVFCAALAGSLALIDQELKWSAPINLNGHLLKMDAGDTAHVVTDTDSQFALFLSGAEIWRVSGSAVSLVRQTSPLAGLAGNPQLELYRDLSVSSNYLLGELLFSAKDNIGNYNNFARVIGVTVDPTNGSEDGRMVHKVQVSGTLSEVLRVDGDAIWIKGNSSGFAGQGLIVTSGGSPKTAFQQFNNIGFEAFNDGRTAITASGQNVLTINRATNDGQLISLRSQGVEQGAISIATTTTTYGTFTGVHWSDWADGEAGSEEIGTVVVSSEELFMPEKDHLPRVALTVMKGDPTVYGVIAGRELTKGGSRLLIAGLGTFRVRVQGSVKRGDLLETSSTAGVAQVQTGNSVRSSTIGKVTKSDSSPDIRLVNVTLCCG
jgi:hypothetical protein